MATTVNFQQDGNDYISDAITANSDKLAFRIKVDMPGSIILERSITGEGFITEAGLPPSLIPRDTLTIEKNITNPDLSVELLSSDLGYSTRQFYRKLKPITDKSPADIIKEYRLTMAERLLLTKNYTIEEIMDKTGFNNRGTFYKLFSQRFGMPPRQYREQQKDSVKKELTDMDSINE